MTRQSAGGRLISSLDKSGYPAKRGEPTDCLIVGYNDGCFERDVELQRSMGAAHPDYRDVRLNFIRYQGKPYRAMDVLDKFFYEGRNRGHGDYFHNADVLWMV